MTLKTSNTIEYAVWTSGVAKDPGAVNILYFPDQSLMYERFRKEKIDHALKFVEFTKKQKRSQIRSRNHEEAKIQRLRNATQTYYCDFSRWGRFGTELQLFSRFLALETCTGYPRTHKTANDLIRKRLLRRRNYYYYYYFYFPHPSWLPHYFSTRLRMSIP